MNAADQAEAVLEGLIAQKCGCGGYFRSIGECLEHWRIRLGFIFRQSDKRHQVFQCDRCGGWHFEYMASMYMASIVCTMCNQEQPVSSQK